MRQSIRRLIAVCVSSNPVLRPGWRERERERELSECVPSVVSECVLVHTQKLSFSLRMSQYFVQVTTFMFSFFQCSFDLIFRAHVACYVSRVYLFADAKYVQRIAESLHTGQVGL